MTVSDPSLRRPFWMLLGFALVLRIAAAFLWPNVHQADEVFQTLEPAHRLWFGYGVVPWEWREGIRSWLVPGILAPLLGGGAALGFGQPGYAALVAVVMAATSLSVVVVGFGLGARFYGRAGALLVGVLCALWFEFVYFGPKTLTEVMAAHVLVVAVWFVMTSPQRLSLIGGLLGLTFILRFHTAPMLLLAAFWVCGVDVRHRWPRLVLGAAIPVLFQALLDWVTLGAPLQSVWLNLWLNVGESRSELYGVLPFYWYPGRLLVSWGPPLPFILVTALLGIRRAPLLGWMVIAHLAAHSLIAHKELRFLFPAMPLLIILAGLGMCGLLARFRGFADAKPGVMIAATVVVALLSYAGAANPGFANNWISNRGGQSGMAFVRGRADLCGLAFVHGPDWRGDWTPPGGYYRLHRNVPMYLAPNAPELSALSASFNYAVLPQPVGDRLSGYERLGCWTGVVGEAVPKDPPQWCAYRRPGTCTPNPPETINEVLRRQDE